MLGAGGMGNVYRAHDNELDEVVALKVLRPELASAPGALDRFRREVKLARRVTHPNVARVFDLGEVDGERILTMELVEGESLAALLPDEHRLTLEERLRLFLQVCDAVQYAHYKEIVHRDLKPENVLLTRNGRLKLIDFDLAQPIPDPPRKLDKNPGTPHYMSPEQLAREPVDQRADIWAFGVSAYELLTYRKPFPGDSADAVFRAQRDRSDFIAPRQINPDIPPALEKIVLRCLEQDPALRYPSMSVLTHELRKALYL